MMIHKELWATRDTKGPHEISVWNEKPDLENGMYNCKTGTNWARFFIMPARFKMMFGFEIVPGQCVPIQILYPEGGEA